MTHINKHEGIILSAKDGNFTIILRRGGIIKTPIVDGVTVGDLIVYIVDEINEKITDIILKSHADKIIKCSSNHLYDMAFRNPIEIMEENEYNEYNFIDLSIFGCSDIL